VNLNGGLSSAIPRHVLASMYDAPASMSVVNCPRILGTKDIITYVKKRIAISTDFKHIQNNFHE